MNILSRFTALGLVLGLAGCEATMDPPAPGAFVPFQTVMAETEGRPWECSGFDAVSATCEVIGRTYLRGSHARFRGYAAFNLEGNLLRVGFSGRGRVVDGRTCVTPGSVRTDVTSELGPEFEKLIEELFQVIFGAMEGFCGVYYRGSEGSYVTAAVGPDGAVLADSQDTSHFFAEQPRLRPLAPE